jgi:hypothetical protein
MCNKIGLTQVVSDRMKLKKYTYREHELVFTVIPVMLSAIKINNKESSDVKRPEFAG